MNFNQDLASTRNWIGNFCEPDFVRHCAITGENEGPHWIVLRSYLKQFNARGRKPRLPRRNARLESVMSDSRSITHLRRADG